MKNLIAYLHTRNMPTIAMAIGATITIIAVISVFTVVIAVVSAVKSITFHPLKIPYFDKLLNITIIFIIPQLANHKTIAGIKIDSIPGTK
ncbi:MAG: hypothetical protein K8R58_14040 [Bacteroidales bacterium]|nr:hypothetical protein [Bacteroidales bacterium]